MSRSSAAWRYRAPDILQASLEVPNAISQLVLFGRRFGLLPIAHYPENALQCFRDPLQIQLDFSHRPHVSDRAAREDNV
ncbi:hypothetical protein AB4Z40_08895 [Bosea sp. 2YAB26]|uniref:hypothetical protein n=1 Tax=Bosea sp. 2YAB26 TaxID=3237478 RepID=UPI003F8E257B